MNRCDAIRKTTNAVSFAGLLVFVGLLCPGAAQACCTCADGINCAWGFDSYCCGEYCVSSNKECVCGDHKPVCNMFACDCNSQCGEWPCIQGQNPKCYWIPTCNDSAEAEARFNSIDGNHDGKISLDEASAWTQSLERTWVKKVRDLPENLSAPGINEKEIVRFLLDQIDTNKDGFIQPVEFDKGLAPSAKTGS